MVIRPYLDQKSGRNESGDGVGDLNASLKESRLGRLYMWFLKLSNGTIILTTGYHDITASGRFISFGFEKRMLEVGAISQECFSCNTDARYFMYEAIIHIATLNSIKAQLLLFC